MARQPRQTRRRRHHARPRASRDPYETRASEAITVAWTVSVTGVLVANLIVVAANLYARLMPHAQQARVLEAIILMAAAAMGAISLALLPFVWRSRRVKPPPGYVVFAVLVAAAPIVVLAGRLLR